MKKVYASAAQLLLVWLLLLVSGPSAFATHGQAGQLTYESLGNNQYRVTASFFRDCSGNSAPGSLSLVCRLAGCSGSSSTQVTASLSPLGQPTVGSPYCAGQPGNVCNSSSAFPNYEIRVYQGTVTLPPAAEWVLSVTINARPFTATLVNSNNQDLRMQATLNNLITLPGNVTRTIVNNSPQFNNTNLPVPFVCVNQQSTISFTATDADRLNNGRADSLVYSLEQPLHDCSILSAYVAYPAPTCTPRTLTSNPACMLTCPPTLPATYSATLPILVKMDTVGVCPNKTVVPSFYFNAQAGSFTFTPARFVPAAQATNNQMENKYVVVGKVTEYRRINGVYYKVGSVRRDFLVVVINCGGNGVPSAPLSAVPDSLSHAQVVNRRDTTLITAYTCNYSRIRITFPDPNPQDQLTVFYPSNINTMLLQNGDIGTFSLSRNGTNAPIGTFYLQPQASTVNTQVLLNFRIEDNACPVKGTQYRTIVLRVRANRFARIGASASMTADAGGTRFVPLCAGSPLTLTGAVSRPDSVRQGNLTVAQTYTYQWSASQPGALDPRQAATPAISVSPTVSTRYFLRILPGLGAAGCGDTTSILVQVAPTPRAAFRVDSVAAGTNSTRMLPPITYTFTNTSATGLSFPLDSARWTYQRTKDGAGRLLTETEVVFSRQQQPAPLVLGLGGEYLIRLYTNTTAGSRFPCPGALATYSLLVPTVLAPNVISPNGDGLNETFVVSGEQVGGQLRIYNHWGRLIQQYDNYQNEWNASGQPGGVYYYIMTDRQQQTAKGWVEVLR
jgi:gliding motility-associated-like protein